MQKYFPDLEPANFALGFTKTIEQCAQDNLTEVPANILLHCCPHICVRNCLFCLVNEREHTSQDTSTNTLFRFSVSKEVYSLIIVI